jgi:hypothetical protein
MRWNDELMRNAERLCPSGPFDGAVLLAEPPRPPFGREEMAFAEAFSAAILKSPAARALPEVVALGFWLRRANVTRMRDAWMAAAAGRFLVGRGLVFHLAPANVETMFVYSTVLSLLAGNANAVRVSPRLGAALDCLVTLLDGVLRDHAAVARRVLVARYGHDDAVTGFLSSVCHARIVWGGDEAVRHARAIPLPAHASELVFGAKFSVAAIDAAAWNAEPAKDEVARAFCLDAFTFRQQGCSCPKLVYWCGAAAAVRAAQGTFWPAVERAAATVPGSRPDAAEATDRLVSACAMALGGAGTVARAEAGNHAFVRLTGGGLDGVRRREHAGHGLFWEGEGEDLDALLAWFEDADQTVASYGIPAARWEAALRNRPPRGICRIVRFGTALEFSPVWDGHDLLRALTREIVIAV